MEGRWKPVNVTQYNVRENRKNELLPVLLSSHSAQLQPKSLSVSVWMACAWDFQFRVLLLGDSGVGKTSLLRWYTEGEFTESTGQTVGVDFCCRVVELESGEKVRLQFWDTAGQERYR